MKLNPNATVEQRKDFIKLNIQLARYGLGNAENSAQVLSHLNAAKEQLALLKENKECEASLDDTNANITAVDSLLLYLSYLDSQFDAHTAEVRDAKKQQLFTQVSARLSEADKTNLPRTSIAELSEMVASNQSLPTQLIAACLYCELFIYDVKQRFSQLLQEASHAATLTDRLARLKQAKELLQQYFFSDAAKQAATGSKIRSFLQNLLIENNNFLMAHCEALTFENAVAIYNDCREVTEKIASLSKKESEAIDIEVHLKTTKVALSNFMLGYGERLAREAEEKTKLDTLDRNQLSEYTKRMKDCEPFILPECLQQYNRINTKFIRMGFTKKARMIKAARLTFAENIELDEVQALIDLYDSYATHGLQLLALEKPYLLPRYQSDFIELINNIREGIRFLKPHIELVKETVPTIAEPLSAKLFSMLTNVKNGITDQAAELQGLPADDNTDATLMRIYNGLPALSLLVFIDSEICLYSTSEQNARKILQDILINGANFLSLYNRLPKGMRAAMQTLADALKEKVTSIRSNLPDTLRLRILAEGYNTALATANHQQIIAQGTDYLTAYKCVSSPSETANLPTLADVSNVVATSYLYLNELNAAIRCYKLAINNGDANKTTFIDLLSALDKKLSSNTEETLTGFLKRDVACYQEKMQQFLKDAAQEAAPATPATNTETAAALALSAARTRPYVRNFFTNPLLATGEKRALSSSTEREAATTDVASAAQEPAAKRANVVTPIPRI